MGIDIEDLDYSISLYSGVDSDVAKKGLAYYKDRGLGVVAFPSTIASETVVPRRTEFAESLKQIVIDALYYTQVDHLNLGGERVNAIPSIRVHADGWIVYGFVQEADGIWIVEEFIAVHDDHGVVIGDTTDMISASNKRTYEAFIGRSELLALDE